ncbi:MAG: phytoene/squalene synthase family protein [Bacteroidetes bacterium]|nr:phytoene/squalene synthase family protein [Bacteroidota bacterium]
MITHSPNADGTLDRIPSMAYAKILARTYSKSFYLATQFLSPSRRQDVYAVYAFCRYTDNIVDAPRSRDRRQLKQELDNWRDELLQGWEGGESQHPVLVVFLPVLRKYGVPLQLPLDLIKGVEMDLTIDRYQSFAELKSFCYRVASVVGLMMTYVFGYRDRSAFPHAEALGIAMQLTNILRDIDEDWQLRGKVYLPQDEMMFYGVGIEDIAARRVTPAMRAFLKVQVERAHSYFDYGELGIPLLHRQARFAVRSAAALYREILREIERADYNVFVRRPVVSGRRKLLTLITLSIRGRFWKSGRQTHSGISTVERSDPDPAGIPPVSSTD